MRTVALIPSSSPKPKPRPASLEEANGRARAPSRRDKVSPLVSVASVGGASWTPPEAAHSRGGGPMRRMRRIGVALFLGLTALVLIAVSAPTTVAAKPGPGGGGGGGGACECAPL